MCLFWKKTKMRKIFLLVALFACAVSERIQVTIFYDSLDPKSTDLILNQLYPTFNGFLKGSMDLKMVPFGKMSGHLTPGGVWEWECMKGPINCYANKVHACIFGKIPHLDHQMEYVTCLLKNTRNLIEIKEYPLSSCVSGEELESIKKCADSKDKNNEGDQFLAAYKNEVSHLKSPLHDSVGIALNNEINDTFAEMAKKDFTGLMCKNMKDQSSEICEALKNIESSALANRLTSVALLSSLLLYSFS